MEIETDGAMETELQTGDLQARPPKAPRLRITDFGLTRDLSVPSGMTRCGSVLGTPGYMSPEQTDSGAGSIGWATDIYGLGGILYFMLCRKPPIEGSSLLHTIKNVQQQQPVPPRSIRPDIPVDLESICLKCLEKRPRERYQSTSELQSDLLRFQAGLPVQARRPSPMDRALMWCRRRPAVSALAASLLIVLAFSSIALGFLLVHSNSLKSLSDRNATRAAVERDRSRQALQAMTSGLASNWLGAQRELTPEQRSFLEDTIS